MSDTEAEEARTSIDDLLDQAVGAINRGDRNTARALAGQVLAVEVGNADAEELLAAPGGGGEIRRLTILFADLVDSTALSTRIELEVYRTVVGRYRQEVDRIVNQYGGHIGNTKGDGLLAVFGHPIAHENDAHRAVFAGLEIVRAINALSERVNARFGFEISVRVGIHRGLVYLDIAQDDLYGLGANVAARVCSIAAPGTVAVSEPIEQVVHNSFELVANPRHAVKGMDDPLLTYRAVGERDVVITAGGPLIGRERELAYLQQSWAHAKEGALSSPGVAFAGEGGIGKTRLAYAAVEMAQQDGAVVLGIFGSPFYADVGLRPVRRLLERRCGIKRDSDPAERLTKLQAELAERALDPTVMVPLLAPVLGIDSDSGYESVRAQGPKLYGRIVEAVHDYVTACVSAGPALVLVDDVHWFDEDTVEVLQALLRETNGRLMVVITGRKLPPLPETAVFEVTALNDADTDKLVRALHPELRSEARSEVYKRCDGIPLYIEEVVAKLKDQSSDGRQSLQVPDTLYETLFARLRSGTDTLPVVEAAALIGSRFDRALLSSVVDLDEGRIDELLEELARVRVLEPTATGHWRFHHELLREVAAEVSPPTIRRRLHGRIADALVGSVPDANPEWSSVARHYELAERFDEAANAYQQASTDARRRGALNEARTCLNRALANIDRTAATAGRDKREVAVRLEAGLLASVAQGFASTEAAGEFERCLQLIGPDPTPELYATLNALWSYYTARGDLRRGIQVAETLGAKLLEASGVNSSTVATMGLLDGFRGDFDRARDTLEQAALGVGEPTADEIRMHYGPSDPIGGMLSFLAFVRFIQGDVAGADSALERMEAQSRATGFPQGAFSLCYGRSIEALIRAEGGQPERCVEVATELTSLAKQYGFDEWLMVAWSQESAGKALLALADGDPAALAAHVKAMTTVVQTWRSFGVKTFLAYYDGVLARLLTAVADRQAARDCLDATLKMGQETLIQFYDAELLRLRAHTLDDAGQRHRQFRDAIELAQKQGAHVFELRSCADDFELVGESARPALIEACDRISTDQSWPDLARARALLG